MQAMSRVVLVCVLASLASSCGSREIVATTTSPDGRYVVELLYVRMGATVMPETLVLVRESQEPSQGEGWFIPTVASFDGRPTDGLRLQWVDTRRLEVQLDTCGSFEVIRTDVPIAIECATSAASGVGR